MLVLTVSTRSGRSIGQPATNLPVSIGYELEGYRVIAAVGDQLTSIGPGSSMGVKVPLTNWRARLRFEHLLCCPTCGWPGAEPLGVELHCVNSNCHCQFSIFTTPA